MPSKTDNATSVSDTTNLSEPQVWELAPAAVEQTGRVTRGRADLFASDITTIGLQIERAEPPVRHALIRGWHSDKERQKQAALLLALAAHFHEKPSGDH